MESLYVPVGNPAVVEDVHDGTVRCEVLNPARRPGSFQHEMYILYVGTIIVDVVEPLQCTELFNTVFWSFSIVFHPAFAARPLSKPERTGWSFCEG